MVAEVFLMGLQTAWEGKVTAGEASRATAGELAIEAWESITEEGRWA